MSTLAVLPIKSFDRAKQRLQPELSDARRRALAEAMFSDVLVALRRANSVDGILVVSADRGARMTAGALGAMILDDLERGHNEAAARGIAKALELSAERALLIPGDCPLLDPGELEALTGRIAGRPSALIVPDRHGTGTNALLLSPPDALAPSFGPGSCARHTTNARSIGLEHEVVQVPSLALDIDEPDDLAELQARVAATRGGAAHTRGLLSQLTRSRV
jgi:2-phospho-L-lactate guanylyltransferase